MTKEITKAKILQEIADKFKLRDLIPETFAFLETVVPTYDIGNHVKRWESVRFREAISAGGTVTMCTVPDNERWYVRKVDIFNETGGNFNIAQIFFYGGPEKNQYLYTETPGIAAGGIEMFPLVQDLIMARGDLNTLRIYVSSYVTAGYVSIHMLREVEVIR